MGIFQRAHDIVQAKTNKALDAAEKPDEMLDLSYEKMLEQITQVRRALVDLAASKKRLELQEEQFQHTLDHLQDQAKQALGAGGRTWPRRRCRARPPPSSRSTRWSRSASSSTRRRRSSPRPSTRCRSGSTTSAPRRRPSRPSTPRPRPSRRSTRARRGSRSPSTTPGASLQRAQDKIATMQARSGALDELLESGVLEDVGGGTDDIQKELDQVGKDAQVDNELAALKAQLGTGGAARARCAGRPGSGRRSRGADAGLVVRPGECAPTNRPTTSASSGSAVLLEEVPGALDGDVRLSGRTGHVRLQDLGPAAGAGIAVGERGEERAVELRPAPAWCGGSGAHTRWRG